MSVTHKISPQIYQAAALRHGHAAITISALGAVLKAATMEGNSL